MLVIIMKTLFELGKMVVELHESGADKPILDAIHQIVNVAHTEIKAHHKEHV